MIKKLTSILQEEGFVRLCTFCGQWSCVKENKCPCCSNKFEETVITDD